jgi:hypothetical protein
MNKNEKQLTPAGIYVSCTLYRIRYAYIYATGRTASKLAPSYGEFSRFTSGTKLLAFLDVCHPSTEQDTSSPSK